MNLARLGWRVNRLASMSPAEVTHRMEDQARKYAWTRQQVKAGEPLPSPHMSRMAHFGAPLPCPARDLVDPDDARRVVAVADGILAGHWEIFGLNRDDIAEPDWFLDPISGRRAPQDEYCFRINHRSEAVTGNVKQVWEVSRFQHVTVLAAAYALSQDDKYARAVDRQLRSWWSANPFLSGVNWTSGIELGVRLISWAWVRRLLDGWEGAGSLFEENPAAQEQIWWHQNYLHHFPSRDSSANNHVIAEAAGQLVGTLVFPWYPESSRWRAAARDLLQTEIANNTFPSGANREMAFDYHGFVAELGLIAGIEADRAGQPLDDATWATLGRMVDVIAATVDQRLHPPRFGDSDDGRGYLLGDPESNRWSALLSLGQAVFGAMEWWPPTPSDPGASLLAGLARTHEVAGRPKHRPAAFLDAGLVILRTPASDRPEIWCRCDAGPHGFLSIAAHAHADALAVEVRHGGVEVLSDPGTYCYHGEPQWRSYFRSTFGHNTVELDGQNQSFERGPFMWSRHAHTDNQPLVGDEAGELTEWSGSHDGYMRLDPPARHRRTVRLVDRSLEIVDVIESAGSHRIRAAFHLGPEVSVLLDGPVTACLAWPGEEGQAVMTLPGGLRWTVVQGRCDPPLGWYSATFGRKQSASVLVGEGTGTGRVELRSLLQFG